ncbi:MAG: YfhO family protein [Nitrospirae bacterium]|nr:YfhO family protein [Nitrospirota bacterium]
MKEKLKHIFSNNCNLLVFLLYQAVSVFVFQQYYMGEGKALYATQGDFPTEVSLFYYYSKKLLDLFTNLQWNPYEFSGLPFLSDLAYALYYPSNVVLAFMVNIFNPEMPTFFRIYEYYSIAGLSTGGFFMYLFLYRSDLKLNKQASFVGGLIFMYSGTSVLLVSWLTLMQTVIWYPLIFLYVEKYLNTDRLKFLLIASLFHAFSVFAGTPELNIYFGIPLVLFIVFKLYLQRNESCNHGRNYLKTVSLFLVVFTLVTILVTAVELLPAMQCAGLSARTPFNYSNLSSLGQRPVHKLLSLFLRELPVLRELPESGFFMGEIYDSLLSFILFLTAIYFIYMKHYYEKEKVTEKMHDIYFWSFTTVLSLLLYLSKSTILWDLTYNIIPYVDRFRSVWKYSAVSSFALAIISAIVLNAMYSLSPLYIKFVKRFLLKVLGIFVVFVLFFLFLFVIMKLDPDRVVLIKYLDDAVFQLIFISLNVFLLLLFIKNRSKIILSLLIILLLVDTSVTVKKTIVLNSSMSPEQLFYNNEALTLLQEETHKGLFRVVYAHPVMGVYGPMFYNIESIGGHIPLVPGAVAEATGMAGTCGSVSCLNPYLLGFLNVKYVYTFNTQLNLPAYKEFRVIGITRKNKKTFTRHDGKFHLPVAEGDKVYIYELTSVFPRFFFNYSMPVSYDFTLEDSVRTCLEDVERSLVNGLAVPLWLDQRDYDSNLMEYEYMNPQGNPQYQNINGIKVNKYENSYIDLDVNTDKDGMLVITNTYYPGWRCVVDGQDTKIYNVYGAYQGILLKTGKHRVQLTFRLQHYGLYLTISMLSLIMVIVLIILL